MCSLVLGVFWFFVSPVVWSSCVIVNVFMSAWPHRCYNVFIMNVCVKREHMNSLWTPGILHVLLFSPAQSVAAPLLSWSRRENRGAVLTPHSLSSQQHEEEWKGKVLLALFKFLFHSNAFLHVFFQFHLWLSVSLKCSCLVTSPVLTTQLKAVVVFPFWGRHVLWKVSTFSLPLVRSMCPLSHVLLWDRRESSWFSS